MISAVFFREDGFYILDDLSEDEDWAKHAELNPGTLRIEDINGNVLWQPSEKLA